MRQERDNSKYIEQISNSHLRNGDLSDNTRNPQVVAGSRSSSEMSDKNIDFDDEIANEGPVEERKRNGVIEDDDNRLGKTPALNISGNHMTTSTPRDNDVTSCDDVMDLSKNGGSGAFSESGYRSGSSADDLALSPPHSYTTQVRNVIRQRILVAGGSNSAFDPVLKAAYLGVGSPVKAEIPSGEESPAVRNRVVTENGLGDAKTTQNDANNNEPDVTPKMVKPAEYHPKRLDSQMSEGSGEVEAQQPGKDRERGRPLSTPPEPLSLVTDSRELRSLPRSTSLISPGAVDANLARNLALQMTGGYPTPLAVMASHNLSFFHQATAAAALRDSGYHLGVPPLLRPGSSAATSRGLSPVGMFPLGSPLPSPGSHLPSPGSQRDSSGSPTDLNGLSIDDDGRDVTPNGEPRTYRSVFSSLFFRCVASGHWSSLVPSVFRPKELVSTLAQGPGGGGSISVEHHVFRVLRTGSPPEAPMQNRGGDRTSPIHAVNQSKPCKTQFEPFTP